MLSGPADAGPDALVEACEAALVVHAEDVTLNFSERSRAGQEVKLRFTFDRFGSSHRGQARCVFQKARSRSTPPTLVDLDATGRLTPARFLASHHAVWRFFRGDTEPEIEVQGDEPEVQPKPAGYNGRPKLARLESPPGA